MSQHANRVVGGLLIAFAALLRLPTLSQPLVEAHTFRQTQTAYTALIYHREGINLLQTPLPTLGPPWVIPFELPIYQAIAAIVMDAGAPTEVALRLTSLVFFVISAALLWTIVSAEISKRAATFVLLMFLFAPLGLLWSRTSTIETLAVSLALATVLLGLKWDRGGPRALLVIACIVGCLAALVKLPTAAVWLAPACLLLVRRRPLGLMIPLAAAAAGLAWTAFTDGIKAASPATAMLTSAYLREWNFGTLGQRLDLGAWAVLAIWATALFGLVVFVRPIVIRESRIGRWAAATLALGPMTFMNLYVVHDYYWMAVAPAAAILSGLVVDSVASMRASRLRTLRIIAVLACLTVGVVGYPRAAQMFGDYDESNTLELANEVRMATTPSDLVAITGRDWSPDVLFYADRRGFMEWKGAPLVPPGYVLFNCPAEGRAGACVRVGLTAAPR